MVEITGNTRTKDRLSAANCANGPAWCSTPTRSSATTSGSTRSASSRRSSRTSKPGPDPKKPQDVTLRLARHRAAHGVGFDRLRVLGRLDRARASTARSASPTTTCTAPATRWAFSSRKALAPASRRSSRRFRISATRRKSQKYSRRRARSFHEPLDVLLSRLRRHGQRRASVGQAAAGTDSRNALSELHSASRSANIVATSTSSSTGATGEHRAPSERLHDSVAGINGAQKHPVQHDRAVAVLLPRQSAEHLRGADARARSTRRNTTMAAPSVSPRRRSPTSTPALRTNSTPALNLANDHARRSVQSARAASRLWSATTFSAPAIGSNFQFTQSTLDVAKFFPVLEARDARRSRRRLTTRPASFRRARSSRSRISRCAATTRSSTRPTRISVRSNCASRWRWTAA